MAVLYRDLRKYLFLREDTCRHKPLRCRASACSATASPTEDRFDQTTSRAANFSSARSTTHNWGMLRLGIARPIRRPCGHAESESDASQQTIGIPDRGLVLQL